MNGAVYGSNKSKMAATAMLEKFQVAISPQPVVPSTSCSVLGLVFGDGGSNGAIFDSNKFKMAAAAILYNFEWPYLRNGSRIYLYSAHRAVIFAIAQLSCFNNNRYDCAGDCRPSVSGRGSYITEDKSSTRNLSQTFTPVSL